MIKQISFIAYQLLKALRLIEFLERKESPFIKNVKALLSEVCSYSSSSDHPLGFYLEQFAGQKWLPFPLIEMLRALDEEALLKHHESLLLKWCYPLEASFSERLMLPSKKESASISHQKGSQQLAESALH